MVTPKTVLLIANDPTIQNIRIMGISTWRGMRSTCRDRRIAKNPNGRSARFAKKKAIKTAYEIGVRLVGSEMCIRDSYAFHAMY